MGLEFTGSGAAGVLAVPRALVQRALLRVGGAATDARVHEVATLPLDDEASRIAGEPLGGLDADRAGAFELRRRVVAHMDDQRGGTAPPAARPVPVGEGDERVGGRLLPLEHDAGRLVGGALLVGDAPDRLLEGGALLERQPPADGKLALATRPRHAERAALIQRLVVGHQRRRKCARGQRDLTRRLADRKTGQLGIARRRRELGRSSDLIERQRARTQRVVKRGQLAQRALVRVIRAALR